MFTSITYYPSVTSELSVGELSVSDGVPSLSVSEDTTSEEVLLWVSLWVFCDTVAELVTAELVVFEATDEVALEEDFV